MTHYKIKAGSQFPIMTLPSLSGDNVELGSPQAGNDWQLIVVYRGLHCPLCTRYLTQLQSLEQKFYDLSVDIVAVSGDSRQQAEDHQQQLQVKFPVAYGLSVKQMQKLGLYVSEPRSAQETDHAFAEPGLFVVNDLGQVQIVDISNAPFVRPDLQVLLNGVAFIRDPENNYPIRGTYE